MYNSLLFFAIFFFLSPSITCLHWCRSDSNCETFIAQTLKNTSATIIADLYILRLHDVQFRFYADDTQLYISFSVNDDLELTSSIAKIENCLSGLDKWMALNKLKLNKDKSELLYLYSKHNPQQSISLRFGFDLI